MFLCFDIYLEQRRREGEQVSAIEQYKIGHFSTKKNKMVNEKADEIWVFSTTVDYMLNFYQPLLSILPAMKPSNFSFQHILPHQSHMCKFAVCF